MGGIESFEIGREVSGGSSIGERDGRRGFAGSGFGAIRRFRCGFAGAFGG